MACTNCSTGKDSNGTPRGCQNNGTCGTDSCNKLAVFDWLSNMVYPTGTEIYDIVEVRFKNGRKDFYRYPKELTVSIGDIVATESSPGHDIGIVSLAGELVKVQMKKKKADPNGEILKIYRKATQKDIDIWQEARAREEKVKVRAREMAIALNLEMKISDVEFQGDASKATFYYTASERVDFRQLIKDFAREFSIRIEMKQVGFRQEAARLGGVGSCGRELCCSTWLTDFRSVNTSAARYQQLSLNPQKLAGQCGKLKCCLNFELDTYLEALKDMPDSDTKLMTVKGLAICQKIDIFKGQMWFAYINNSANWYVLDTSHVKEILALNKRDEKGLELESYMSEIEVETTDFEVAAEHDSVTRFDQPKRKKRPTRNKKPKGQEEGRGPKKENAVEQKERPVRTNDKEGRGPKPQRPRVKNKTERPNTNTNKERVKEGNNQPIAKESTGSNNANKEVKTPRVNRPNRNKKPRNNNPSSNNSNAEN
ncbi:PSP1 domain-containing protein [Myroides phaeus]|uniref:Cell fate regulator YaaT, PSP1 superfamily (Controls sporulation, competence, biofilm development) n=1 Tax=Myroides phaeus TaxID=702745 RepID=A0A1G8AZX7_9FLAO|nr:regulatory iron-sulfur-containing complex subunit RicT [Myroides phaeus]SDH26572.1 Cell fate regulator YaaT, PSP1 superfamily (controls sporulation, competence, biofilm development) [Myroides phaeus]